MNFLYLSIFCLLVGQLSSIQPYLLPYLEGKGIQLTNLAQTVESLYQNRCNINCPLPYHACVSWFPTECKSVTHSERTACAFSVVRLPLNKITYPNDSNVRQDICYSYGTEVPFLQQWYTDETLTFLGFGSESGVYRSIPARYQKDCFSYDPRLRPWYSPALTGHKDILLLIDLFGIRYNSRREMILRAATQIILSLSPTDSFNVLPFGDSAQYPLGDVFMRANSKNKQRAIKAIESFKPSLNRFINEGFDAALSVLHKSQVFAASTGCNAAILLLADMDNQGYQEKILVNKINLWRDRSMFFYYTFGYPIPNENFWKSFSCKTSALWRHIPMLTETIEVDSLYLNQYFASITTPSDSSPRRVSWTEPYRFATVGIWGVTASTPIYDFSVTPPKPIGVIGMDFAISSLNEFSDDTSTILFGLMIKSTKQCTKFRMTNCNLDSLRINYKCYANCSTKLDNVKCWNNVTNWSNVGFYAYGKPRSGRKHLALIICLSILFAPTFFSLFFLLCCYCLKFCKRIV